MWGFEDQLYQIELCGVEDVPDAVLVDKDPALYVCQARQVRGYPVKRVPVVPQQLRALHTK
jgi:hypothetical protein